ncbi:MAG TPA: addiction module protein [Candidatus Limnocylindria bacterium]|nr:addiction module protein [Candidatus Limnocylindria bacterium]
MPMTQDVSELLKKALTLPVAERAELAGSLIESLDRTEDESVEAAWDEEIGRRMANLDWGRVQPVSAEEAPSQGTVLRDRMTARQLSFHPDAIDEAEAAARWYRQRSARVAGRFVDELNCR